MEGKSFSHRETRVPAGNLYSHEESKLTENNKHMVTAVQATRYNKIT